MAVWRSGKVRMEKTARLDQEKFLAALHLRVGQQGAVLHTLKKGVKNTRRGSLRHVCVQQAPRLASTPWSDSVRGG